MEGCLRFFDKWLWTYNPRLAGKGGAYIKFDLWPKQRELVRFIYGKVIAQEEGLVEKSRDVGATFVFAGFAMWAWRFIPGFKTTFGSRITDYVDKKDNPDSIFTKIRTMLYRLPPELLPRGFIPRRHDTYMMLTNPSGESSITGEGGENLGRGGRSSMFVLDEAAFVANASEVEKALSANAECVMWVSSVNGMGNLFARKRHEILRLDQIFRLHWRDDPRKTEEWARAKKASYTDPSGWASEYDIDYSASVEDICIPAAWVESCKIVRQLEPRLQPLPNGVLGLDVGAGKAKSVAIPRRGPVVEIPRARGEPDTADTAFWGIEVAKEYGMQRINFDAPGVGAGVSSTLMKNPIQGLRINPINTGVPASEKMKWPDGRTSLETFGNQKAELWWLVREAAHRTHEHVLWLQYRSTIAQGDSDAEPPDGAKEHEVSTLLALPSGDKESNELCQQLSLIKKGRDEKGKIVIEKKADLRRRGIKSPDHADALVLTYAPDNGPVEIVIPDSAMVRVMRPSQHGRPRL